MEIIVVSDTHMDLGFIDTITKKHPNAEMYLHAGDACRSEKLLAPFITVKGNCDVLIKNPYRILEVEDFRVYMFHGHNYSLDSYQLAALAKSNDCQMIIHGHTHIPRYEYVDNVHILCPGSIRYSRSSGPSYAKVTISEEVKVEILDYEK